MLDKMINSFIDNLNQIITFFLKKISINFLKHQSSN